MGFPNSVEEIDEGLIHEGLDELSEIEYNFIVDKIHDQNKANKLAEAGYGYWLDNCGDGVWYCEHCLQPDCNKRMAQRKPFIFHKK